MPNFSLSLLPMVAIRKSPVDLASVGKFVPLFYRSSTGKILKDPSLPRQLKEQFLLLQQSSLLLRGATKSLIESLAAKKGQTYLLGMFFGGELGSLDTASSD